MSSDSPVAALDLSGYGVAFGRRVILSEIDLVLPADGIDVLMGPVYTGKSTLMRSLAGLNRNSSVFHSWGTVRLSGRPLADDWRPALVQQHASVISGTVGEALVHQVRQTEERSASHWWALAAREASRFDLDRRIEGGLDAAMLDQSSETQRQINILSHALARPPLLFIDEPTFGLDERASMRLIEWLASLVAFQRMVVALHHQGQARKLADRVVLLGGGRVLAFDANPRFFTHPANAWADQFVRTGSLYIASPQAKPDDLAPDIEAPPPLPPAAVQSVAHFEREGVPPKATTALAPVLIEPDSDPQPQSQPQPQQKPQPQPQPQLATPETASPVAAVPRIAEDDGLDRTAGVLAAGAQLVPLAAEPVRKPAALPAVSPRGVEQASAVGQAVVTEYRGPAGFHWIVPGRLAGCAEPGGMQAIDYDLQLLKTVGVSYLITLTEKDLNQRALAAAGLRNLHLPINDREAPSMGQAYMLVKRMQKLMDQGEVLAVHCKAGIGRTGTVLAAWLIREGGLSASAAIARLRSIQKAYVQTETQEEFLRNLEIDILKHL